MLPLNRSHCPAYSQEFSRLKVKDNVFLLFRDIPDLVEKYVNGTKTLDYGCGVGRSSAILKSLGLTVTGVDIDAEMINKAKAANSEIEFQEIKSGEIPAADECYDLVFTSLVLQEISSKDGLKMVVGEIARVLKPKGTFIAALCAPHLYKEDWIDMKTNFEENKNLQSGEICKVWFKDLDFGLPNYFWTDDDYKDVFKSSGLSLMEIHNPLGKDGEGYDWKNEKIKSPWNIFVAKKQ